MAHVEDIQDSIDIWSNSDGLDVANKFSELISRIFSNPITQHDISTLSNSSKYREGYGTLIIVITDDTLHALQQDPSLAFGRLISNCVERFYVDEYDLLASDHNTRVSLLGAENVCKWTKVDVNDLSARKISQATLTNDDSTSITRTRNRPSKGKRKGLFTVVPNEFWFDTLRRERSDDGVVIIDPSVFENGSLSWKYVGDPVTAYLVNNTDKSDNQHIDVALTPVIHTKVFKFKLPDNVKPTEYMMHIRDGNTAESYKLGNRRIKVKQHKVPINDDLFSEENLAELAGVTDLSTNENCKAADEKLCDCYVNSQLPLKLPQYLGRKCPTLLHVACYYGLEKLLMKIMDSFCSLQTLNFVNNENLKPEEIARKRGYTTMADSLRLQLRIQDLYVEHAPMEAKEFHDIYCTVSFESAEGSGAVYVTDVIEALNGGDNSGDSDIYSLPDPKENMSRRASAPLVAPRKPPNSSWQTQTLPLYNNNTGLSYEDESGEDEDSVERLKEQRLWSWTKRLKSFKNLKLEDRLQGQEELMKEQQAVIEGNSDPPPIPTRTTKRKVKKLPAVPPKDLPKPTPRRQISKDSSIGEVDENPYIIPIDTVPLSPQSMPAPRRPTTADTPPVVLPRSTRPTK